MYLLALLQACSRAVEAATATFPGTVEVDLIFPRNDTYMPSPLMPIVFAIQNSNLAAPLDPGLSYHIEELGTSSNGTNIISGILDLRWANFSSSGPYFAFASTSQLINAEGTWLFSWTLASGNCSGSPENGTMEFSGHNQAHFIIFTTKNGSQQPDLVAATEDATCAKTESHTFNVTGILDVPNSIGSNYDGRDSCAVLSPASSPAPNPCGAKVDSVSASSISAALTATACASLHPVVSCPPLTKNAARGAVQFSVRGAAWLTATFGWLAYILNIC